MSLGFNPQTNEHLWVVRQHNQEPAMLVKSKYPIPSWEVIQQTYQALYPDTELMSKLDTNIHRDDGFTPSEWNTWLAFDIAPAIEIYTDDAMYYEPDTTWKWRRITA